MSSGYNALAINIDYGSGCDLLRTSTQQKLFSFLRSMRLRWCGNAMHNLVKSQKTRQLGPTSRERRYRLLGGLPSLSRKDEAKVKEGNSLLLITCYIIRYCIANNICWVLENPYSSRAWLTDVVQALQQHGHLFQVDSCQYREPWKKPTGLLSGPSRWPLPVARRCSPQHGRCSASGRKHIPLVGTDATGKFMTLRAQVYPTALCSAAAASLPSTVPVTG